MTFNDVIDAYRDEWFWRNILKKPTHKTYINTVCIRSLSGMEAFHNALSISACRAPGEEEAR